MNYFMVFVWGMIAVMWSIILIRTFKPFGAGKTALRTINKFMKELGYEASQYNYIEETSINEINWGDGHVRKTARAFNETDRKIAELTQRVYEMEQSAKRKADYEMSKKIATPVVTRSRRRG